METEGRGGGGGGGGRDGGELIERGLILTFLNMVHVI